MSAMFLAGAQDEPQDPSAIRYVAISVLLPALLLVMALWFSSETRDLNATRAMIRNSFAARIEATDLLRRLAEAEAAERGFVVTGEPGFLADFDGAHEDVTAGIDMLEQGLAQSAEQHGRLVRLRALVVTKFAEMSLVIDSRRQRGLAAGVAGVSRGQDVLLTGQTRSIVDAIIAAEQSALSEQLAIVSPRNLLIQRIVWALAVVIALFSLIGPIIIWRVRTARFAMEREAYEASLRLRAVFASTIDAILILTEDGRIAAANHAAITMLGADNPALIGTPILPLIGMDSDNGSFREVFGFADGVVKRRTSLDRTIQYKDGPSTPVDIALGVMQLPDKLYFVATLRDISERKAGERLKDEFIATVSHELRTPLTSVVGALGLLRAGAVGDLPDAARRLVNIAENNSQRLIGLINDILDIEKIGSGRMHFESRPVRLDRVAREAVEGSGGLAQAKRVHLEFTVAAAPVMVDGDPDRLTQVLTNLLSNAIRFSPADGTVRIDVASEGEEVIVSVEDEGPGVPAAFEARIFERFSQAGNNPVQGGTGLGLAISREIMRAQGGRIWFDRAAGGGARFAIALPLAVAAPIEPDGRHARLLVCEDQPDIAEVLRRLIEAEGCTVDCVATAQELEAAARTGRYDGIVLDLVLPDASGLDAVRRLRRRAETQTTPIIVVSAFADVTEADPSAAALDVIDWIAKPVDQQRLMRAVRRAIDRAAVGRATLLHVDDDIDMLEVTATALAEQGRMLRATSLASARALLAETTPDIIILDLALPDGSGLALLPELLAADGSAVPTIIYSAEDVVAEVKQQVDAVIVKSRRSLPSLAATIHRLLVATRSETGRGAGTVTQADRSQTGR